MIKMNSSIIGGNPWIALFATTKKFKKSFYLLLFLWLLFSLFLSFISKGGLAKLVTFFIMITPLTLFYKYRKEVIKKGADEKAVTDMNEFLKSEKLPPALAGLLIEEYAGDKEIVATILNLAVRGYIDMQELPNKDVEFLKTNKQEGLREYEWLVQASLFGDRKRVRSIELYNKFFKNLKKIEESIYEEGVKEGLFVSKPNEARKNFMKKYRTLLSISATFFFFLFSLLSFFLARLNTLAAFYSLVLFSTSFMLLIILRIMSYIIPKKTSKGAEEASKYLQFKEWLSKNPIEEVSLGTEFIEYLTVFGINMKYVSLLQNLFVEERRDTRTGKAEYTPHEYDAH